MLYIRTDGNAKIGTGHIMRCLSIADAYKKQGGEVAFICADKTMLPLIADRGYSIYSLGSEWNRLESELNELTAMIASENIKELLIDSYFVTEKYLKELKELTTVIYIDDLDAFNYPCDMLINYNCYANDLNYPKKYPNTKLILGCEYVPLREEFKRTSYRSTKKEVQSILITMGGTDPHNIAYLLAEMLKIKEATEHFELKIIAGRLNPHIGKLNKLAVKYEGICICSDVKNMSELMMTCDIAISAGGSTLYELCACGVPTVVFSFADNQQRAVRTFGEGYMINAGDVRDDEILCIKAILEGVTRLSSDYKLRCDMSKKIRALVDGNGADRVAKAILEFSTSQSNTIHYIS